MPLRSTEHPQNVELPVLYKLSVYLGHLGLDELHVDSAQHQPFSTLHVEWVVKPADVRRIPVKDGTVRGMLFLPPGEGPFPGVIDMFGLAGGIMEIRAAMLAAHGFAALALPFYRYDDLPKNFTDQTYDYFEVKAFVHINGSGFSGTRIGYPKGKLPTKGIGLDLQNCPVTEEGMILRDGWLFSHEDFIPLWERNVHLLTLASDDDGQVHPSVCDLFASYYPEDRRHLVEVVHYPGAGHLLEPPYTPHCRFCYNPFFDVNLMWGGRVKEHAVAQEESWQRIQQFLKRHLPSSPQEGPVQN